MNEPNDFDALAISLGYDSYDDALQALADKFGFTTFDDLEDEITNHDPDGGLAYFQQMTHAEHEIWCAE